MGKNVISAVKKMIQKKISYIIVIGLATINVNTIFAQKTTWKITHKNIKIMKRETKKTKQIG